MITESYRAADPRLQALTLRSRGIAHGLMQGLHASPFLGHSVEFSSHRRYTQGDDPRHVNWKLFARHRKLYVKEYDAETNLNVHLVLDASPSMACQTGGAMSKFECAASMALAIAMIAINQHDAVGMTTIDDDIIDHTEPSSRGGRIEDIVGQIEIAWRRCQSDKAQASAKAGQGVSRSIGHAAEMTRGYGVAFVLSDLIDDEAAVVDGLQSWRYRHHDTTVLQVLDPWERWLPEPGRVKVDDLESSASVTTELESIRAAYLERVDRWIGGIRDGALSQSISHHVVTTDRDPAESLLEALLKR